MADVKWIKITTSMFDDEKIRIIESMPDADAILVIWIKLLTLAGKNNTNGFIFLSENIPYTDEMLSTIFNRPLNTVRLALQTFKQFGMVDYDEKNFLYLVNWEKHQNIEGLEKIREQTRKRVAKHRENQKALTGDVTLPVTQSNATDKNKNKKENREIYTVLFDHWNSLKIIVHQKLTSNMENALDKVINDPEYFITCMNHYATAFHDESYELCSYAWSLENFIERKKGYRLFADDGEKWINYQSRKKKSKPSQKYDDVPALTFDKPTMYATKD